MKRLLSCVFVLAASPAWAQRLEVTPLVSYTTAAEIEQTADDVDDLTVSRGLTWGGQGTYFVSEHLGLEALWTYQSTEVRIASGASSAELFTMTANQLLGNVVYQFGGAERSVRPFVLGGLGATFFSADDLESETKLAWTVGGGVKWFPQRRIGLKAQARYKPTQLDDSGASFCDPFGFCQTVLKHFEIAGGAIFRF